MAGNVRVHRVVNAMEVAKDPVWEFETSDITVSSEQNTITKNRVKKVVSGFFPSVVWCYGPS